MPKAFTENEKEYFKQRLKEEAQSCLIQYGAKKTTVDELVKRVNIPKGTFYLFYASKEHLFFDVFCAFHDEMQTNLIQQISTLRDNITAEKITTLIFQLYKKLDSSFFVTFLTSGDVEMMMRKLPEEYVKAHAEKDDLSMERLLTMLPGIKTEGIKTFSAALRAIFTSMLHKREIGEDIFDDALKVMIHGVILQIFEEESL